MSGGIKVTRIKSKHKTEFELLGEVTKTAISAIPKLRSTAANRVAFRNMEDSMSALGSYVRANGFDPTRTFQHVANYDTEIWTLVLDMFARYDDEGNLMDDGLLYKYDPNVGTVRLNKAFFYALLDMFESMGVPCDMRGKIKIN